MRFELSAICTLCQLCIRCGSIAGRVRHWRIDHQVIREYLSPLVHLERLVFLGDSYDISHWDPDSYEEYYDYVLHSDADHIKMMRRQATKYIRTFPGLRWMYMGERQISIETDELYEDVRRVGSIERFTYHDRNVHLNRMFGSYFT